MRTRALLLNIFGNGAMTASSSLAGLFSVPLMLGYIGPAAYGFWVALTAIGVVAVIVDLGLGNALMSRLADSWGRSEFGFASELISSGFAVVSLVSALAAMACAALILIGGWRSWFEVPESIGDQTLLILVSVAMANFVVNIPISYLARILPALQQGHWLSAYNIISTWAALAVLWISVRTSCAISTVVFLQVLMRLIGPVVAIIHTFVAFPMLLPKISRVRWPTLRRLLGEGARQMAMNLGFLLSTQVFFLVAPHTVGLEANARFAVAYRFYSVFGSLLAGVFTPFWPAVADAKAKGDGKWISRAFSRLTLGGLGLGVLVSVVLYFALSPICRLLGMRGLEIPGDIRILFGLWMLASIWIQAAGNLLQGLMQTRFLVAAYLLSGLMGFAIVYQLGRRAGEVGLLAGWLLVYGLGLGGAMASWVFLRDSMRSVIRFK